MAVSTTEAINAFKRAQSLGSEGISAPEGPKTGTFAEMLKSASKDMLETGRAAENATAAAIAGATADAVFQHGRSDIIVL